MRDFDDHNLSLFAQADLATRHSVTGSLSVDKSHERFGLNFTRGEPVDSTEQVEFVTTDLTVTHTFGAADARGNIETGISIQNRNYLNEESLTSGFSFTRILPSIALTYRLSSTARALLLSLIHI